MPGGNYEWGGCGTFCHTSPAIGAGAANTAALAAHDHGTPLFGAGTHPAAKACADYRYGGYDDWFLPSNGELLEMNKYRQQLNIPEVYGADAVPYWYWSSSERVRDGGTLYGDSHTTAWYLRFWMGAQEWISKHYTRPVRAIRQFYVWQGAGTGTPRVSEAAARRRGRPGGMLPHTPSLVRFVTPAALTPGQWTVKAAARMTHRTNEFTAEVREGVYENPVTISAVPL
ncbi:MAG: hypothetical protein MdMp014T_2328 [Treponematales bacterium]